MRSPRASLFAWKICRPPGVTSARAMRAWCSGVERDAIYFHNAKTGALIRRLEIAAGADSRMLCSPDGSKLAAFRWPRRLAISDLAGDRPAINWKASDATVQAFVFSPDGRFLASGGSDNLVTIWDAATGARIAALRGHKAAIHALAFTPDGRTLASASADQTLRLWHVATWRDIGVLRRGAQFIWLAFAGETPALFALEYDRGLHVFRGK